MSENFNIFEIFDVISNIKQGWGGPTKLYTPL